MGYIRVLAAIGIIAVGASTVYRGWNVARFSLIEAGVGDEENLNSALHSYFEVGGLASLARAAALLHEVEPIEKDRASKRLESLADLLSSRPLASAQWLSLARVRFNSEEPQASVLAALALSDITGGYEEDGSIERIAFCLSMWEDLPTGLRSRSVGELATILSRLESWHKDRLQKALIAKTERVRQEIRTALLQTGHISVERLNGVGL